MSTHTAITHYDELLCTKRTPQQPLELSRPRQLLVLVNYTISYFTSLVFRSIMTHNLYSFTLGSETTGHTGQQQLTVYFNECTVSIMAEMITGNQLSSNDD